MLSPVFPCYPAPIRSVVRECARVFGPRSASVLLFAACLSFATAQTPSPSGTLIPGGGPYPLVSNGPATTVSGDFNGDGKPDVAIYNLVDQSIEVYLGDGAGGFLQPPHKLNLSQPVVGIAAADLNHDGKTDLVVITQLNPTVTLLSELSDGSGNFMAAFSRNIPAPPGTQVPVPPCCTPFIADFNGDGNPDVVMGSSGSAVLLGDGTGGFVLAPSLNLFYQLLAVADFNGDGLTDLLVYDASSHLGYSFILLSDGKGGFRQASPGEPIGGSIAVAGDLNGDGFVDLVSFTESTIEILLGDGKGNFTYLPQSEIDTTVGEMSFADLNGDGILDMLIPAEGGMGGIIQVFLGNGDGTFSSDNVFPVDSNPQQGIVVDLNGDGKADVVFPSLSKLNVLLGAIAPTTFSITTSVPYGGPLTTLRVSAQVTNSPGFATPQGYIQFSADGAVIGRVRAVNGQAEIIQDFPVGTHSLAAAYEGDSRTLPSASAPLSATVTTAARQPQKITFTAPSTATFGLVGLTAYGAESGNPIVMSVLSGPGRIVIQSSGPAGGSPALLTTATGTITIEADLDGNATYAPATPVTRTIVITQASQTIQISPTLPLFNQSVYLDPPIPLQFTASSGLPVVAAVQSGPGVVTNNVLTIQGAGTIVLEATQAGNANYLAAPPFLYTLTVVQASQTITFAPHPFLLPTGTPFAVEASASSGLPVTLSVAGPGQLSGNLLTINGSGGIVTVTATQAGTANLLSAMATTQFSGVSPNQPRIDTVSNGAIGAISEVSGFLFSGETAVGTADSSLPLAGVAASIQDSTGKQTAASLYYVSPTQIDLVIPEGLTPDNSTQATLSIVTSSGQTITNLFWLRLLGPEVYSTGLATRVAPDGSSETFPFLACTSTPCTPAPIGLGPVGTKVYLMFYGTGFRHLSALQNVSATLGGVPAAVISAGAQSPHPGLDQITVLVDPFTGPRLVDFQMLIDNSISNTVQVQFE